MQHTVTFNLILRIFIRHYSKIRIVRYICNSLKQALSNMATKISDDLKNALLRLPTKDKDKLLLRLIAKSDLLVKQLEFDLLEDKSTIDSRAAKIRVKIEQQLQNSTGAGQTPGYLLMDFRYINPAITEHVKVTKDKYGEVTLAIYLLSNGLRINKDILAKFPRNRFDTLAPYIIKRVQQILVKIPKLHEDYYFEIRRDLNELLDLIYQIPQISTYANEVDLPKKWDY